MLTVNQENYCNARLRGLTQRAAYREAYPRSVYWKDSAVDSQACQLEASPKVSQRLNQMRKETSKAAKLDKQKYLKGIDTLFNAAHNVMGNTAKNGGEIDRDAANAMLKAAAILIPEAERAEVVERPDFAADFALLIQPDFFEVHRMINTSKESDFWLKGGRGSAKSSEASLEVVNHLETHPMEHAVVLMKYATNLRTGVVPQVEWAFDMLGVTDRWEVTSSPMQARNKRTGQLIFFRGCDDPRKLKSSIKPPFGFVGIVWYEEADLFNGMSEIRSVNQSLSRGGSTKRIYTYNPPRSKHSWVNKHTQALKDSGKPVFDSSYLHVPKEWLGDTFLEDAEWLKANDEQAYRHEYLGEPVGMGTDVFDRVEFREITDAEIASFDNFRAGQDFGWYPDPWAFTISEFQQANRTLLTFFEDGGNKLHAGQQAERILQDLDFAGMFHSLPVLSDDAAPDSIEAQRAAGVQARAAQKGGMREASYRLLQSLKWVIDPARCPHLAEEVRSMQYEVNKDGEVLNTIPDGNDHWVDATRYALMRDVRRARNNYVTHNE